MSKIGKYKPVNFYCDNLVDFYSIHLSYSLSFFTINYHNFKKISKNYLLCAYALYHYFIFLRKYHCKVAFHHFLFDELAFFQ
ncbi:hypothetical protein A9Q62_08910 [Yersinia ruckeri]|nr:hypothetical protein A9Q62_08910 [Yersinia ruckeri]OJB89340.1 hypothetical protein A9Q60_08670 [Yersinia ruckeri]